MANGLARVKTKELHTDCNGRKTMYKTIPTGPHEKISWGAPAQITQVKIDRECICGNTPRGAYPLELVKEGPTITAGYCPQCGFSF